MAVSFKVPASPAKSIFTIDEFLGVDLTNSPANIQDNRSPNAPNMTRLVPGKVRKRMGYEKEVLFGTKTNVNWALGTSSEGQAIDLEADNWKLIYRINEMPLEQGQSWYMEFDYKAEAPVYLTESYTIPASAEWSHISLTWTSQSDTILRNFTVKSDEEQTIYFKKFAIMLAKDHYGTEDDPSAKWSPAPKRFIERSSNDPIYGFHVLKSGTFDGNRVVNVNRALSTSATFETISADTSWQTLYTLGEVPAYNRKVFIEFDYELTGDNAFISAGQAYNSNDPLTPTTEPTHKSITLTCQTYSDTFVKIKSEGSSTVQIKNFSLMYEKNDLYVWSPAPEDRGETFPIEDTYYSASTNYAIINEFDDESIATGGTATVSATIASATSNVEGFSHVAFDLHTSSYKPLVSLTIQLVNDQNQYLWQETYTEHLNSKHFDFYISAAAEDYYVKKIVVNYTTDGGAGVWTHITNIVINSIKPKTDYNISSKQVIYHVGKDFYLKLSNSNQYTKIYEDANEHLSKAWQFNKRLFIMDGKNIYSYYSGDEEVQPINESTGYIPILTIAKSPKGGGTSFEPLNMLQPGFYEMFQGTANGILYDMSFGNLDSTPVKVWVLNSQTLNWDEKIEGTDFIVNRGIGEITFNSAPGVSPITGEDNVKILAYRTVPGYRDRIANCTNGALFGVGGAQDRLFLTGNPEYPNYDFFSEQYDPTYFPDTGYAALGSEQSAIVGYAIVNNYLATFKDDFDTSQTVFIREGDLIKRTVTTSVNTSVEISEPAFKLINTLQGNGVVAPYAFGYITPEPLFLTKSGIYAITVQDITGEKYSQNRSFYLNGELIEEPNLDKAVATVFGDMYYLAINNKVYILDGLQATRTDRSDPYSTRQYVGFVWNNIPATIIYTDDDYLWFGTADGKICRFYKDVDALESYNDDGYPIDAWWETPDLDGRLFYKNKTFRYYAARLMSALATSVKMWAMKSGAWTLIKTDNSTGRYFDFGNVNFEKFSFSTDQTEKVVHTKIKVKKVDKARFKLENDVLNEPFGLFNIALEYVENGNYKG